MHQMRCHSQGGLLLNSIELRQSGRDQALNALLPQQQKQAIKQFTHLSFRAVAVERSVLQLTAQGMGFIPPQLSVTGNSGEGNGGKSLGSRHGRDAHVRI